MLPDGTSRLSASTARRSPNDLLTLSRETAFIQYFPPPTIGAGLPNDSIGISSGINAVLGSGFPRLGLDVEYGSRMLYCTR